MQQGEASGVSAQVEEASWLEPSSEVEEESSPALVADMLDALEAEESTFEADELSEEGNPT
jgi:hypothetical protein